MTQPDIPRAVASGDAGPTGSPDRVRPGRVTIVVGILASIFIASVFSVRALPGFALRLVGQAPDGVARYGGVVGTGSDGARVELSKISEANATDVIAQLGPDGGVTFAEVIELDHGELKQLVDLGLADASKAMHEPHFEVDQWRAEDQGGTHRDSYLSARDPALLDRAFAEAAHHGWAPPTGSRIIYERVEPVDREVYYRTYAVSTTSALTGIDVADAVGTSDPRTNRPLVAVSFTPAGTQKLGELTARLVGHKLATILGDRVRSAPVINGAIRGGRVQITMGGNDARTAERERDLLVDVLHARAGGYTGTLTNARWVAPSNGSEMIALTVLALLAGLVSALLAVATIRFARPEVRTLLEHREPVSATTGVGRRVAWTLFAVVVVIAGSGWVILPGINELELFHVLMAGNKHAGFDETRFSIFALGLAPLLTAFVTVEIAASIVPRWRRYRDGLQGRRKLDLATAILGIAMACIQAFFVATYLRELNRGDGDLFNEHMFWSSAVAVAGGPIVLAILASLITSRGIGNGYAVVLTTGWLFSIPWLELPEVSALWLVRGAITVVAIALFAIVLVNWRVRAPGRVSLPLPIAGLVPLTAGGGALVLLSTLRTLGFQSLPLASVLHSNVVVAMFAFGIATVGWAFVFARPGRRSAVLAPTSPASGEQWLRAVVLSAVALGAVFAIEHLRPGGRLSALTDPVMVMLATVTILDLASEWRARRRGNLVAVWPLHDPLLLDEARDRLAAAEIPSFVQAARFRTLVAMFASYAPMVIFVPADRSERAHALLRDWLEPGRTIVRS